MGNIFNETGNQNFEGQVLKLDEKAIQGQLREFIRSNVEESINALLDAEAAALCGADRFERSSNRVDTRAGTYERKLDTSAGKVTVEMPKLRRLKFETQIIERYQRREASVEEALIEMYLAGVSVRRVEDITEALWGSKVSPGTISNLNKKVYERIEAWLERSLERAPYRYVYLDGIWLKRTWGGEVRNVAILVAVGVDKDGYREILAVTEGSKEDKESWLRFLRGLKKRGLTGTELFITDKCLGLVESLHEVFPEALWQRCVVHFYRNVFSFVPSTKMKKVAALLKAIHASEDKDAAERKTMEVIEKLKELKLANAAKTVTEGIHETFGYYAFPQEHWRNLRTNNMLERLMREIRRRTRVVGNFPDGRSAVMLSAARLRHVSGTKWGVRRYMTITANESEQVLERA